MTPRGSVLETISSSGEKLRSTPVGRTGWWGPADACGAGWVSSNEFLPFRSGDRCSHRQPPDRTGRAGQHCTPSAWGSRTGRSSQGGADGEPRAGGAPASSHRVTAGPGRWLSTCCAGSPGGVRRVVPRLRAMLLSDRDITAAIAEGRLGIEPYDKGLVPPARLDVRLDPVFRVFNNARYTHIDPAEQQDDLTA